MLAIGTYDLETPEKDIYAHSTYVWVERERKEGRSIFEVLTSSPFENLWFVGWLFVCTYLLVLRLVSAIFLPFAKFLMFVLRSKIERREDDIMEMVVCTPSTIVRVGST